LTRLVRRDAEAWWRVIAMWLFGSLGIVAAIAATIRWWQRLDRAKDLGGVSDLWLAQFRQSQTNERG